MDNLKDLKTEEIQRIYNSLILILSHNIPCDEETCEDFRRELASRPPIKPIEERIAWTILNRGKISHTALLQHWSRYANSHDICDAVASLQALGEIEIMFEKKDRGRTGKVYVWRGGGKNELKSTPLEGNS